MYKKNCYHFSKKTKMARPKRSIFAKTKVGAAAKGRFTAKQKKKARAAGLAKAREAKARKRKRQMKRDEVAMAMSKAQSEGDVQREIRKVQFKDKKQKKMEAKATLRTYCKSKGKLRRALRQTPDVKKAVKTKCGSGNTHVCKSTEKVHKLAGGKTKVVKARRQHCRKLPEK
jgi:hypothetical protein